MVLERISQHTVTAVGPRFDRKASAQPTMLFAVADFPRPVRPSSTILRWRSAGSAAMTVFYPVLR